MFNNIKQKKGDMMHIFKDAKEVIEIVKSGQTVFVGNYSAFDKKITPQDALIFSSAEGFIQRGVERKGCDFKIETKDIEYTVEDTKSILDTGQNLMGGNVALVFFEY